MDRGVRERTDRRRRGKAVGLGALTGYGRAVPDGFVVVTDAYRRVIADAGLDTRIEESLGSGDTVADSELR